MYKKVIYRDKRDGETKWEWFKVKGSRNKSGMTIDRQSEIDSIKFMNQDYVEYLGSFYHTDKQQEKHNGTNKRSYHE